MINAFSRILSYVHRVCYGAAIQVPLNSQDLLSNSPYCLPYNSYDVSLENLVFDQLIIP